jgi:hypothetical protein
MKVRLMLAIGLILAANSFVSAKQWDDLVFKVLVTDFYGAPIPNAPCHIFSTSNDPNLNQWGYTDATGHGEIKFPAGTAPGLSLTFAIGDGSEMVTDPGSNHLSDNAIPVANGVPDTFDIDGYALSDFYGNIETDPIKLIKDSIIVTDTIYDPDGFGIPGATATIRFKHKSGDTGSIFTATATTDGNGIYRYALCNTIFARAALVSVSKAGYSPSPTPERLDSIPYFNKSQHVGVIWDGTNDLITPPVIVLAQSNSRVAPPAESIMPSDKPVTLNFYALNGRLINSVNTTDRNAAREMARQHPFSMQKTIVELRSDKNATAKRKIQITVQ